MKLSIIIVSWNVREDLLRCLSSFKENPATETFEIIVVDNASTDGTIEAVKKDFPEVIIIANKENLGFSAANNQAIRIAKGQYVFLLNPDTLVNPYAIDNLIEVLDNNPQVGACGPKIINSDGSIYHNVKRTITFSSLLYKRTFFRSFDIFRKHYRKLRIDNFNYDKQADVEQLSGAALMVRKSVMKDIGLMDESFFLYYEDVDLCLRIINACWKITYLSKAQISHKGGSSTEQIATERKMLGYKSMFIYLRKHKGRLATMLFSFIFKPGVIINELLLCLSNSKVYLVATLLRNRKKQAKSLMRIKDSSAFLLLHSLQFLFKV